jgi:hypothetical protein
MRSSFQILGEFLFLCTLQLQGAFVTLAIAKVTNGPVRDSVPDQ